MPLYGLPPAPLKTYSSSSSHSKTSGLEKKNRYFPSLTPGINTDHVGGDGGVVGAPQNVPDEDFAAAFADPQIKHLEEEEDTKPSTHQQKTQLDFTHNPTRSQSLITKCKPGTFQCSIRHPVTVNASKSVVD